MEISLFSAAAQGFLNLLEFQILLAMLLGVSIGTFTAVAPQGLGMPLVYAIALPIVIKWKPITGIDTCCPSVDTGHTAAPPSPAMNSRLLIRSPRRR